MDKENKSVSQLISKSVKFTDLMIYYERMTYKNSELREKLLKRTKLFSLNLINVINKLENTTSNIVIIKQIIRSGTSIGANYREACEAESSKDFIHKIRISKKEAKETLYWLELLIETSIQFKTDLEDLYIEANEFVKIFSSVCSKFKN